MKTQFEKVFNAISRPFIVIMVFTVAAFFSCSKDNTDDGGGASGKGFTIKNGTSVDVDGSAKLSCDGRKQSLSLVFDASGKYSVDTNGSEWLSVLLNAEGEAGKGRTIKFQVTANDGSQMRTAEAYITVEGKGRMRFASISQVAITKDVVVEWIDERLANEYFWLDEYRQMQKEGEINYGMQYDKFLSSTLLSMHTNKDDGYVDSKGTRHLFSYIRQLGTSRSETRAAKATSGLGIALSNVVVGKKTAPNTQTYAFIISHIYPGSAAEAAGLRRGDVILEVNSQSIGSSNYVSLWNNISGAGTGITSLGMGVGNSDTDIYTVRTQEISPSNYFKNPIAYCDLLRQNNMGDALGLDFGDKKIGYISYLSFDADYDKNLLESLTDLANKGVTDLIIDLRSNGGGSVPTCALFASGILPAQHNGETFVILDRHELNLNGDEEILIPKSCKLSDDSLYTISDMNLESICFITSENTASASEMLIMGLRAQGIKSKVIGYTTMGKDCGMDVMTGQVGNAIYEFAPITFFNIFPGYDVDFSDGIVADVNFDILVNSVTDEAMKQDMIDFPVPKEGVDWADYILDLPLKEAVAQILGKSVITGSKTSAANTSASSTRTPSQRGFKRIATIEQTPLMTLTEQEREMLRTQTY